MAALACGCEIAGGMEVTPEILKEHYKHTFESLLFWELICIPFSDPMDENKFKLAQARIDWLGAIDKLFPQAA